MELLMGIDLGSTSIKAAVFDPAGTMLAISSRANKTRSMDPQNPSWQFWDHDELWQKVVECVSDCVAALPDGRIAAVAVTGMGMDGLPVSEAGEPLYPLISWQCKRCENTKDVWAKTIGEKNIFDITGKQVMSIDTIYRIIWVKEHKPEIYSRCAKWLLIEDYINFRLCGEIATDFSMASCTSLMCQRSRDWSDELLNKSGIRRELLPPILQAGTVLGGVLPEVSRLTGLPTDTKVVLGGHDYSCAAVATGVISQGSVLNITGTWEMLFAATDSLIMDSRLYDHGFKAESHVAHGRYAIFSDVISSLMLEWFKDSIVDRADNGNRLSTWEEIADMAEKADRFAGGVFFLPHIMGKGCPSINDKALGAFVGLDISSDIGTLCRSVMEGLNYQFKEMLLEYEKITNLKTDKITVCGGAARNRFLMQNKADISGKTIVVPENVEASLLGASMLAGIGVGLYADEKAAHSIVAPSNTYYYPGEISKKYDHYYHRFYIPIYQATRRLSMDLSQEFKRNGVV